MWDRKGNRRRRNRARRARRGLTLFQVVAMFPDDATAEAWFERRLWPRGPHCPRCGSLNVQCGVAHPTMTHRCRDCPGRPLFSLRSGTLMRGSKLGYRVWAVALYLFATNLKGIASTKIAREFGITQKAAWHLAHRVREAWGPREREAFGDAEADETFIGGKMRGGQGGRGKAVVAGVRERRTGRVRAEVVSDRRKRTLHRFVRDNVGPDATLYTDEHRGYWGALESHERVNHSAGEYVSGMASVNGVESFWAALKRGYHGVFHYVSHKHLDRYVVEFAERHNARSLDTEDLMARLAAGMAGRRLTYRELVAG
ncbi:MAG: IS1595 family transposase [Gammaproteobacteria bacterium]|nr:IS1595 family transposase [Gammaproteobacteria bacterium]